MLNMKNNTTPTNHGDINIKPDIISRFRKVMPLFFTAFAFTMVYFLSFPLLMYPSCGLYPRRAGFYPRRAGKGLERGLSLLGSLFAHVREDASLVLSPTKPNEDF
jgi:hypothetical protein